MIQILNIFVSSAYITIIVTKNQGEQNFSTTAFKQDKVKSIICISSKIIFSDDTITNIEEAQMWLSVGIVKGARNPMAHEEIKNLYNSGLFSETDALDLLSLLSHLFRRLDDAELMKTETTSSPSAP